MTEPHEASAPTAAVVEAARRLSADLGDTMSLRAVATARDLTRAAERAMRATVERARAAGHTWQEIGGVLGTTRQAAFQRFGRPLDPRTGAPMAEMMLADAGDRAAELLADLAEGRWESARGSFGERVAARLDNAGLAATWAQLIGMVGRYERMGDPLAHQAGDYTVVDVPLFFEAGERIGRVAYDRRGKVAGLHFLPAPGAAG